MHERSTYYLRLSITDRCNLRCLYCWPPGTAPEKTEPYELDATEQLRLVEALSSAIDLRKIRLTGGEPLLHPQLILFVTELRRLFPKTELCLTTNGTKLAELALPLKHAGLDRLNISLDSCQADDFRALTGGDLTPVLYGIEAARNVGFTDLKLNTVMLREFNFRGLADLVDFAAVHDCELRFIELMPFHNTPDFFSRNFLARDEVFHFLASRFIYVRQLSRSDTAERHLFRVGTRLTKLSFISPFSCPFCADCDRLRLDSRGKLHHCLRGGKTLNLSETVKKSDSVPETVRRFVSSKRAPGDIWQQISMHTIGG